jgi:hypothetical protein
MIAHLCKKNNYIHVDAHKLDDIKNPEGRILYMEFRNIDFDFYHKYDEERQILENSFRCYKWFRWCDKECHKKHQRYGQLNEMGINDYFDFYGCKRIEVPECVINYTGQYIYYKKV